MNKKRSERKKEQWYQVVFATTNPNMVTFDLRQKGKAEEMLIWKAPLSWRSKVAYLWYLWKNL